MTYLSYSSFQRQFSPFLTSCSFLRQRLISAHFHRPFPPSPETAPEFHLRCCSCRRRYCCCRQIRKLPPQAAILCRYHPGPSRSSSIGTIQQLLQLDQRRMHRRLLRLLRHGARGGTRRTEWKKTAEERRRSSSTWRRRLGTGKAGRNTTGERPQAAAAGGGATAVRTRARRRRRRRTAQTPSYFR